MENLDKYIQELSKTHIHDNVKVSLTLDIRTILDIMVLLDLHVIENKESPYTITHSAIKALNLFKKSIKARLESEE